MRSYSSRHGGCRRPWSTFWPFLVGLVIGIALSIGLSLLSRQQQCSTLDPRAVQSSTLPMSKKMDWSPDNNNRYFQGQIESLDELLSAPQSMSENFDTNNNNNDTFSSANNDRKSANRPTKLLLVGVMTAQKYLDNRAIGVFKTWAQDVPGQVIFFVGGGGNETINVRNIQAGQFTIVSLAGVDDYAYPPQKKSFLMLKYMYENYGDTYEWFMRADDDVYIKADKLAKFLRSINSRQLYFIGQAGKGNSAEKGTLNLAQNENFCMGGPGIILSHAAMAKVAPNVHQCHADMYSTHEDVEIGRCVQRFAGISCTWAYEMQSIFYHNSSGDEAFTYNLNQREVHRGITLHPVKDYRHMYRLHSYIQDLKIQDLLFESIVMQRDLQYLSSKNLTDLHETVREFKHFEAQHDLHNMDSAFYENILQQLGIYGIQPSLNKYQPRIESSILGWDFLGKGLFSGDSTNPKQKIIGTLKESLESVVHDMMDVINGFSRVRGRIIDFNKILWGYYRLNPLHGEDYVLDLQLTYKKYRGRKMTVPVRRHMYIQRPFAPLQLRVITDPSSSDSPINNNLAMILPLSGRYKAFTRFLQNFRESCTTWHIVKSQFSIDLKLIIVYFPVGVDDGEGTSSDFFSRVHNFREQTLASPSCNIKLVQMNGEFSRSIALETGISQCTDNDLVFLIDVDIKFSLESLQRVILNTDQGSRVYFPVVFSQFNPNLYDDAINTNSNEKIYYYHDSVISNEKGYWREYGFGIAGFFKSDFVGFDISIQGWGKEDVSLYEKFISQTDLIIFRAPDPDLVHIYHDVRCDEHLSPSQYEMCLGTQANTLGSVKTLMSYIFKHRPGSPVKRFLQASEAAAA